MGRTWQQKRFGMLKRHDEALEHVTEAFKKDSSEGQENDEFFVHKAAHYSSNC